MNEIEALSEKIAQKENQLVKAKREADSWNSGKYRTTDRAIMAKALVASLEKELTELNKQKEGRG